VSRRQSPISGAQNRGAAARFNFRLQIPHYGDNGLYEHMLQREMAPLGKVIVKDVLKGFLEDVTGR
jgi:hypothetical protein